MAKRPANSSQDISQIGASLGEGRELQLVPKEPQSAFPDLATIVIAPMDNAPRDNSLRLRGVAKFGSTEVMGSDTWYRVHLVSCRLDFILVHAQRDPFHSFAKYAAKAQIIITDETKISSSADAEKTVGLTAKATRAYRDAEAAIMAKYNRARKSNSTQSSSNEMKFQPDLAVIQDTPSGLRIGHEIYGDPTKPGQLLEGAYLHDNPEEPLLVVNLKGESAKICARLRAAPGDLRITDTRTGKRVEAKSTFRDDIDRVMREKIAGIRFQKEFKNARDKLPGIELASHAIDVRTQTDVDEC